MAIGGQSIAICNAHAPAGGGGGGGGDVCLAHWRPRRQPCSGCLLLGLLLLLLRLRLSLLLLGLLRLLLLSLLLLHRSRLLHLRPGGLLEARKAALHNVEKKQSQHGPGDISQSGIPVRTTTVG